MAGEGGLLMCSWPKGDAARVQDGYDVYFIPGGVVSLNRKCDPNVAFARGVGSRVWDVDGNEYIDYLAGFAAAFLGHNDSRWANCRASANSSARRTAGARR